MLIAGWNRAGWMEMPRRVGDRVGRLIGAVPGTVVMGDTLSIKVYQALAAALELNPARRVILSDTGNFLSDLYIADGLVRALGRGYELRTVPPEEVEANIDETVAATLITEIDYRTGCKHDMKWLTEMAHAVGAVAIWDLAHSAGAPPVQLAKCRADFAVGCTYKYLNSGPVGSPPILQLAALDAAMDVSDLTTMEDIRSRSIELTQAFIAKVAAACPGLTLAPPATRRPVAARSASATSKAMRSCTR